MLASTSGKRQPDDEPNEPLLQPEIAEQGTDVESGGDGVAQIKIPVSG